MVAQAFVRIFSPPDDKVDSKSWPQGQWTGKISRDRRPFKDGFASDAPIAAEPLAVRDEADAAGYVSDAVKNVVSGFPTQPPNEPAWPQVGWKGEVHSTENKRNARDGFHAKKN